MTMEDVFGSVQVFAQAAGSYKTKLTAAGSVVNLGITKLLAEAFMDKNRNFEIKVPLQHTHQKCDCGCKGYAITFGWISGPLKGFRKNRRVCRASLRPNRADHYRQKSVKDGAITSEEVVAVYKGAKTKWQDGSDIIVRIREVSDSGFMMLEEYVSGLKAACEESRNANRWLIFLGISRLTAP